MKYSLRNPCVLSHVCLNTNTNIHRDDKNSVEIGQNFSFGEENTGIVFQQENSNKIADYQGDNKRERRDHIYGQHKQTQSCVTVFNLTLGPPDIDSLEYLLCYLVLYSIFILLSFRAKD